MKLKKCEIYSNTEHLTEAKIKEALLKRCIKKWCYILHDKDVYTKEDEEENPKHKEGTLKNPHWHVYIQFDDSQHSQYIARWFGVAEQCVQKCLSGRFEDMCLYATHKNASEKYQYDTKEVKANFDYVKFIDKNGKLQTRAEELAELIVNGEIREYNYTNYISSDDYIRYAPQIEKAFKYRRDMLSTSNRNMDVIFISGKSGYGKTTLAKHIAMQKGYSCFISSSDNDPLDNYKGQDCVILDDLRGSSMKFSELIKMLDNNTNSSVKSRYHNKDLVECKLIIITSIYNMEDFYKNVFADSDEPLLQLQRRCKTYINVNKSVSYLAYYFDKEKDKYVFVDEYLNPAKDLILETQNTKYDSNSMAQFLGARTTIKLDLSKPNKKVKCPF